MLIVKPVQDKVTQERLCAACETEYDVDCLCYSAWVDGELVGICQFRLSGGPTSERGAVARITALRPAKGTDDLDALFIMGRQTMNFIDLSGVHECVLDDVSDPDFAMKLGFIQREGRYYADLQGFFDEPCAHGKAGSPR